MNKRDLNRMCIEVRTYICLWHTSLRYPDS